MGIELGYSLLSEAFNKTWFFNAEWIASIILTVLTLFLITKNIERWKGLLLPVMVGWHIAGVAPFFGLYIIAAIMFAIDALSLKAMTAIVNVFPNPFNVAEKTAKAAKQMRTGMSEASYRKYLAGEKQVVDKMNADYNKYLITAKAEAKDIRASKFKQKQYNKLKKELNLYNYKRNTPGMKEYEEPKPILVQSDRPITRLQKRLDNAAKALGNVSLISDEERKRNQKYIKRRLERY